MNFKKGIGRELIVVLTSAADGVTRLPGKAFGDLAVSYCKEGGAYTAKALLDGDLVEVGEGIYKVAFSAAELDTKGVFLYNAYTSDSDQYPGAVQLTDTDPDEVAAAVSAAVDAVLTAAHGAGSWQTTGAPGTGSVTFTYTMTSQLTGLPLDGVFVWVSTDLAGANVIASGSTDAFGNVVFFLDPGTYYFWRRHSQFTFGNPDTEVVA